MSYPTFYRKDGRCLKRSSDTVAREVRTPAGPKDTLPLSMSDVTFPTKERLDKEVAEMEEVDQACFEAYILSFIGKVEMYVAKPMTEYKLAQHKKNLL